MTFERLLRLGGPQPNEQRLVRLGRFRRRAPRLQVTRHFRGGVLQIFRGSYVVPFKDGIRLVARDFLCDRLIHAGANQVADRRTAQIVDQKAVVFPALIEMRHDFQPIFLRFDTRFDTRISPRFYKTSDLTTVVA